MWYIIYCQLTNILIMKNFSLPFLVTLTITAALALLPSCEQQDEAVVPMAPPMTYTPVSDEVKAQFTRLQFDVSDIVKVGENYLVEGDIMVTPVALKNMLTAHPVSVENGRTEQYRTYNLVSRSLSTIRIRPNNTSQRFLLAIDRAIYNYNQLGLTFRMVRVAANQPAEITVRLSSGNNFLGSAGFPTGNGLPWNDVIIDVSAFNGDDDSAEETVTHEIGHCLGLRHSDWYDRSLSCGRGGNEGDGGVGAVGISGTVRFDSESLMNSCGAITSDPSGEFSYYDRIAIQNLY